MMPSFEMVKLLSDALLLAGLVLLSFRILTTGSVSTKAAQLVMLEASLKNLVRDADAAGRNLNDELVRRQNALERLLNDLNVAEGRLSLTQESIKQFQKSFDQEPAKVAAPKIIEPEIPAAPSFVAVRNVFDYGEQFETEAVAIEATPIIKRPAATAAVSQQQAAQSTRSVSNITQRISQTAADVRQLAQQIEVSRLEKNNPSSAEKAEAPIAAATKNEIPSEVPAVTASAPVSVETQDNRLGVLGGIKRQVQTL